MDNSGSEDDMPTKKPRSTTTKRQPANLQATHASQPTRKEKARSSGVLSSALDKQISATELSTPSSCITISDNETDSHAMSNLGMKRKRSEQNLSNGDDITSRALKFSTKETEAFAVGEMDQGAIGTSPITPTTLPTTPPSTDGSNNSKTVSCAEQQPVTGVADTEEPQDVPATMETEAVKEPTLVEQALEVMALKNRRQLITGDVMLIMDQNDLAKTIWAEHELLLRHAPQLALVLTGGQEPRQNYSRTGDKVCFLAVLNSGDAGYLGFMLVPYSIPVGTPAPADLTGGAQNIPVEQQRADSVVNTVKIRVKTEPEDDLRSPAAAAVPPTTQRSDWVAAYESFFRILAYTPNITAKHCKLPSEAKTALPLLTSLTAIAERYNCFPVIRSAIKPITSDWVSNRSLYGAIAEHPENWLALAIKLQNELAYKEAFVHLVGRFPDVEPHGLPTDIVKAIEREARQLKFRRSEVDKQLLVITLRVQTSGKPKANMCANEDQEEEADTKAGMTNEPSERVVSQHFEPIKYNTINLFRDWLSEHIDFIDKVEQGVDPDSIMDTMVCNHPRTKPNSIPGCLSVSGSYYLLHKAGDGYLPAEELIAKWSKHSLEYVDPKARERNDNWEGKLRNDQAADIRNTLKALKEKAKEVVAPLIASGLQYEGREALPYLTCVDAGSVPWAEEKGDGDEDDVDCD
ncbi:hypothetical protein LTR86_002738 [Recurvomyces mirabilis]|nr:hypothetical protein LTR86_002738 [Recurvomyces mirabilis]